MVPYRYGRSLMVDSAWCRRTRYCERGADERWAGGSPASGPTRCDESHPIGYPAPRRDFRDFIMQLLGMSCNTPKGGHQSDKCYW